MWNVLRRKPDNPSLAKGQRVYAVGDVHGRHDLLKILMSKIIAHWEESPRDFSRINLVFLGDIIDRGPDSDKCLAMVRRLCLNPGVELLRGNHEDLMLGALGGDAFFQKIWLENGGLATLRSFDIGPPRPEEDAVDFGERLRAAIPARLVKLLREAKTHWRCGDYFFTHAGVRPGIGLNDQDPHDLSFIREEFTSSRDWHGAVIVHGHSIVNEVEVYDNRIAVDTGAYRSDKLSCVCIHNDRIDVISTG